MTLIVNVNVAVGVRQAGLSVSQTATAAADLLGVFTSSYISLGFGPKKKKEIPSELQICRGKCLIDIRGQKGKKTGWRPVQQELKEQP